MRQRGGVLCPTVLAFTCLFCPTHVLYPACSRAHQATCPAAVAGYDRTLCIEMLLWSRSTEVERG